MIYDFDVIGRSGQVGLTSIPSTASINDSGTVAFVGSTSAGQGVFVGDGTSLPRNITPGLSADPQVTFFPELEINNNNRVAAVSRRAGASQARIWNANTTDAFTNIAVGSIPRSSSTHFDGLSGFTTINTDGKLAFSGQNAAGNNFEVHLSDSLVQRRNPPPNPATHVASFPTTAPMGPSFFRQMAADGNRVVIGSRTGTAPETKRVVLHHLGGTPALTTIATTAGGQWSDLGVRPGISDDGTVVTFYGDLTTAGAAALNAAQPGYTRLYAGRGIFASVGIADTRRVVVRIAGMSNNGILEPGERWDNLNNNNSDVWTMGSFQVDPGEDRLGFANFFPDMRVGVNRIAPTANSYKVVFQARDHLNRTGVFLSRLSNDARELLAPVPAIKVGETIPSLGAVQDLALHDPINNNGQFTFWVSLGGNGQAIVRGKGHDPIRQTMVPWAPQLYAAAQLSNFITTVENTGPTHDDYALLPDLRQLRDTGKYSLRNKACLLTSLSMALDRLDMAQVSPRSLFTQMNALGGFSTIHKVARKSDSTPKFSTQDGVKVFVFDGADLQWTKLSQLFPELRGERVNRNDAAFLTKLQSALGSGKQVLVNVKNGGHWVLADSLTGSTLNYIDPEFSTATDLQTVMLGAADKIKSIVILSRGPIQANFWIQSQSPIQYVLTAPSSARLGFNPQTQTYYAEIAGSSYGELYPIFVPDDEYTDQELAAFSSFVPRMGTGQAVEAGTYRLQVFGIADGPFGLGFTGVDAAGSGTSFSAGDVIASGQTRNYAFDSGTGSAIVTGTAGADTITLRNLPGDPSIVQVLLNGQPHFTSPWSALSSIAINALGGNDSLAVLETAPKVAVTINGGDGNDTVTVGNAADSLDSIQGVVNVNGDAGSNTLNLNDQGNGMPQAYLLTATTLDRFTAATITYAGIQSLRLSAGKADDYLQVTGTAADTAVMFSGGGGSDGLQGPDAAATWAISDTDTGRLTSPALGAALAFSGVGSLVGGTDNDRFVLANGVRVSGFIDGGGAHNLLDYSAYQTDLYVNLQTYEATGAQLVFNLQDVTGGNGNDILVGDDQANVLEGGPGRDLLIAGGSGLTGAADTLSGGAGEDLLIGGFTVYDTDAVALAAIRAEWVRPTDYADRVANLTSGTKVPLLDATTVFYNYAAGGNTLAGGADSDLFFGDPLLDTNDALLDETFIPVF